MSSSSPVVAFDPPADDHVLFERFAAAVALRQLDAWLPSEPCTVLDLSLGCPRLLALMVERGHTVVHADNNVRRPDIAPADGNGRTGGRLRTVQADPRQLTWLEDASVDAVVAEGGILSGALATEVTIEDVHRVLRPGGGLLLCVDSLVAGLAQLADQGRWAELADVPAADVVLIPGDDGSVTRCFWPEELQAMLTAGGFDVEWIRPRTVLAEETVIRALALDPDQLESLVTTEIALSMRRQGESVGTRLVVSAVKP